MKVFIKYEGMLNHQVLQKRCQEKLEKVFRSAR